MTMRKRNKLLYGVGVNDANYEVQPRSPVTGKRVYCPYYQKWKDMITRCFSRKIKERYPTYKECTVCEEWLTFSNFKAWMEKQDWRDKQLDKDLLVEGNKVYSSETCIFVSGVLNAFIVDRCNSRGKYMLGVCFNKNNKKLASKCNNPITKKSEYLGYFTTELEAHLAWKARKLELVDLLQEQGYIDDSRIYEALKLKYK